MTKENEMEILILTENTGYDGSTYLVAADPEHPIDPCKFWMETREETKEEIQELMDSGYLNWDRQNVTIPEPSSLAACKNSSVSSPRPSNTRLRQRRPAHKGALSPPSW